MEFAEAVCKTLSLCCPCTEHFHRYKVCAYRYTGQNTHSLRQPTRRVLEFPVGKGSLLELRNEALEVRPGWERQRENSKWNRKNASKHLTHPVGRSQHVPKVQIKGRMCILVTIMTVRATRYTLALWRETKETYLQETQSNGEEKQLN